MKERRRGGLETKIATGQKMVRGKNSSWSGKS